MAKIDLLKQFKDLEKKLNKVPTRRDFTAEYGWSFEAIYGSWSNFKKEAKPNPIHIPVDSPLLSGAKPEINDSMFGPYKKRVVILGDLHEPWSADDAVSMALYYIEKLKPNVVIQAGDSLDNFSTGRFAKKLFITPKDEAQRGYLRMCSLWDKIKKLVPKAELYLLMGNHDIRPITKMVNFAPELEPFIELYKYFTYPGVTTIKNPRDPLIIENIAYIHGFLTKLGDHAKKLGMPVVHGHTHRGGLLKFKHDHKWTFELDVGYLGDPTKPCFHYTPMREIKWSHGIGLIDTWGPVYLPFS